MDTFLFDILIYVFLPVLGFIGLIIVFLGHPFNI